MGGPTVERHASSSVQPESRSVEERIRAHFSEPIEWSDPEQALDTAGTALCGLRSDVALLLDAINQLSVEQLDPSRGAGGAYWFKLAQSSEENLCIWLRFCPTGCVAPVHTHQSEILALVVCGTFKQTLIGQGGGVASPKQPIKLYVRHERPGQVFALNDSQQHETSSTAGSLILAATPAMEHNRDGRSSDTAGSDLTVKVDAAIRRLRRGARDALAEGT